MRLPKLYNGKERFFFFFSYNGIYQDRQETKADVNRTVPKMAWRQGDFSDLQALDAVKYTIYDPRSARQEGNRVVRMPFPGNKGIPVLNPLYKFYAPLYPEPNDVPGLVSREGVYNYLAVGMRKGWKFNSVVNRYDYTIAERHRLTGRWYWNHALESAYDWTYDTMLGLHASGLTRINKGGGGNYIWTIGNKDVLDIGASWHRYSDGNTRPIQTRFKPTDVGLPAYVDAKAGPHTTLPYVNLGGVESVGAAYPAITGRGTTLELKASLISIRGNHSLKYGWEERRYWYTSAGPGYSSGAFTFNQLYMRAADNTTTASDLGLGWAAFMMGAPSAMSIDTNDSGYWSTRYRTFYVQDDWRISKRLRLLPGLRYEREGGITERFNRGISGGFLFDAKLSFTDAVQAAYARNALPELPAAQFQVLGGSEYLGTREKMFTNGTHFLLPRIGAVYQLTGKTVVRGGYGWYYDTLNVNNTRPSQYGFSQSTNTVISDDNGLSFCCGVGPVANLAANRNPLVDPFPVRVDGTRFDIPYGNRLGLVALAGRGFSFTPREFSPAWQQRWRIGIQREISRDMVVEFYYNGTYSKIPVTQPVSFLPKQYWATGNIRNQTVDDNLNRNVPNPFHISNLSDLQTANAVLYNYLRTQSFFTSTTIRKHQLLRAYPHVNGLNGLRPGVSFSDSRGGTDFHEWVARMERRFSRGFQSVVTYTRAASETQDYYHDEFDLAPSWRPNNLVRSHHFVWSAIYELPFGKGRTWIQSGPLQHPVGGWQLSWIYQYQSGPATSWGKRFFYGDLSKIGDLFEHDAVHSKDIHVWFDPRIVYTASGPVPQGFAGFEGRSAFQPGTYHVRMFPTLLDALRADGFRNWDLKVLRKFRITERLSTTFSLDLLNATNHTNFSPPNTDPTSGNFGRVTDQFGASRMLQFNLRLDF